MEVAEGTDQQRSSEDDSGKSHSNRKLNKNYCYVHIVISLDEDDPPQEATDSDLQFIKLADEVAQRSGDPNTKVHT